MEKAKAQFKRLSRGRHRYALYCLVGALLFFAAWFFAKNGQITGLELSVFRSINDAPKIITEIFLGITFLGALGTAWILAAIIFAFKRYVFAFEIFTSSTGAFLLAGLIKEAAIRARPYQLLQGVNAMGFRYSDMGFPSIHMAVFAAVAVVLMPRINVRIRAIVCALGLLVGISRIVLGMHAPLDIIGGLGVGLAVGSAVNYFAGIPKPRISISKRIKNIRRKNQKVDAQGAKYAK